MISIRKSVKKCIYQLTKLSWWILPLRIRKWLSVKISKLNVLPGFSWLSMAIIRDWADSDTNAYHQFLWSNHAGYAVNYEQANDFGLENLTSTRRMLFDDIVGFMTDSEMNPAYDIESVFEVGCSSGYLLRHMETEVFPAAQILEGIDIDCTAVKKGRAYLEQNNSIVYVHCANMEHLDKVLNDRSFDMFLCAGVLMYLNRDSAEKVVASMLSHAKRFIVITGRACTTKDNSLLDDSITHEDGTQIHNLDAMVAKFGGQVQFRRWEGRRMYNGYDVYFLICTKNGKDMQSKAVDL